MNVDAMLDSHANVVNAARPIRLALSAFAVTLVITLPVIVAVGAIAGCASGPSRAGQSGVTNGRSIGGPDISPYRDIEPGRRDPLRAQALTQEAAAIMDRDPQRATALLREALVADLWHGPAHNNLGVLHLRQGHLYDAAGEFEWARKLMPGHPDPRMNLALTLERAGRLDDAVAGYEAALEVWPGHIQTVQALARLHVRERRADARLDDWLSEIALRGETEQWREWARAERTRIVR